MDCIFPHPHCMVKKFHLPTTSSHIYISNVTPSTGCPSCNENSCSLFKPYTSSSSQVTIIVMDNYPHNHHLYLAILPLLSSTYLEIILHTQQQPSRSSSFHVVFLPSSFQQNSSLLPFLPCIPNIFHLSSH